MKKLMMALAAVAFAVGAQAAAVTWAWTSTCYDGYNNNGGSYTAAAQAGTMYIFNANETGVSQAAVFAAFLAGTDLATLTSMDHFTTADGKMASSQKQTLADPYTTFAPVRENAGKNYVDYFYAMVIEDGDKTHLFMTDTNSAQVQTAKDTALAVSLSTPSKAFKGENLTEYAGAGWYTQSVPEPTSGLLLLLGMAGLALKRKHA